MRMGLTEILSSWSHEEDPVISIIPSDYNTAALKADNVQMHCTRYAANNFLVPNTSGNTDPATLPDRSKVGPEAVGGGGQAVPINR